MQGLALPKPARTLGALALAAVLVASCAPQQPGTTTPSGGQAPAGSTATTARPMVLRFPSAQPKTLDPGLATDSVSNEFNTKMFDTLVELDKTGKVIPMLAESWVISPDAKKFTFTMKANAKWSDGQPVKAQDAEYAIKRVLDPATASEYAETIVIIKNGRASLEKRVQPSEIGVKATNDRTLEIELEESAAYFLAIMTTWTTSPLRKDIIDKFGAKWTDAGNVVTSGQFKLTRQVPDQQIVLERFEEYHGTKPKLSRVEFRIFPDADIEANVMRAYEADELDTTGTYGIPASEVDRVLADSKLKNEVKLYDRSASEWVCVNNAKKPFDDVRVRRALGYAIERERMITALRSVAKPAWSFVPEGIPGRNPAAFNKTEDANQAKQLLAQAGYPNGQGFPKIVYTYNASTGNKNLAEYVAGRWKEVLGIDSQLESPDFATFVTFRRNNTTYDAYRCAWGSDYEDPYNWYNKVFASKADPGQFSHNWKNAQFDDLVARAAGTSDVNARVALYQQAEKIMSDEYIAIPLLFPGRRVMVKPYVSGYDIRKVAGGAELREVTVNR